MLSPTLSQDSSLRKKPVSRRGAIKTVGEKQLLQAAEGDAMKGDLPRLAFSYSFFFYTKFSAKKS